MILRIWNSLFRGNKKTKAYLWTLLVLTVFALSTLVVFFITWNPVFAVIAALLLLIGFAVFKSVSFKSIIDDYEVNAEFEGSTEDGKPGENFLNRYTDKALKAYFHKFKVSKEHYSILIDSSRKYKITQCPAFIWKDRHSLHIFLLEENPRKISIPVHEVTEIFYLKGAAASPDMEYEKVKNSPVMKLVFQNLIPEYYKEGVNGRYSFKKNLYGIAADILITAASAKAIIDRMQLRFEMSSMYIGSGNYSLFFKEASKLKVLWKDGVLDNTSYKNRIRTILNNMALAEYSVSEYTMELERMVMKQLITDEYALYYKEHRQEIRKNKQ